MPSDTLSIAQVARLSWSRRLIRGVACLTQLPISFFVHRPMVVLILIHLYDIFRRYWIRRQQYQLGILQVQGNAQQVESELIQGCLISTEHLLTLGRVEKRTLFTRQLLDVLEGNSYLVQELLKAAEKCQKSGCRSMVTRWLPPDERYHVLQACLNAVSSLFGPNFVHFNALNGERSSLFKSTWYCITVTMPTRPRDCDEAQQRQQRQASMTAAASDITSSRRPALRVTLVNESELRRIADGKLSPPSWGFFNSRHATRYHVIEDFAKNFQMQLVRTPADGKPVGERSQFISETVHVATPRPDGGLMKRVQSQPNLVQASHRRSDQKGRNTILAKSVCSSQLNEQTGSGVAKNADLIQACTTAGDEDTETVAEGNCFLRLHVPHYVGESLCSVQEASMKFGVLATPEHGDLMALGHSSQPSI